MTKHGQTISCPSCRSEIEIREHVCPECGKPRRLEMIRSTIGTVLFVIGILLIPAGLYWAYADFSSLPAEARQVDWTTFLDYEQICTASMVYFLPSAALFVAGLYLNRQE